MLSFFKSKAKQGKPGLFFWLKFNILTNHLAVKYNCVKREQFEARKTGVLSVMESWIPALYSLP